MDKSGYYTVLNTYADSISQQRHFHDSAHFGVVSFLCTPANLLIIFPIPSRNPNRKVAPIQFTVQEFNLRPEADGPSA